MKTRALVIALPLLAAVACQDNRGSITIDHICQPPDECTFSGTCDEALSQARLDVGASTAFNMWLYLQVRNQLPDNSDEDIGRTDTNGAHVDEFVIEYEGVDLPETTIVGNPASLLADSITIVKVEIIPDKLNADAVLQALAPTAEPVEIVANLRMRGYFDDGTRFETDEFPVGIQICTGCVGLLCGGGPTCPPNAEGQVPFACPAP
jgi:hypothetical protein